MVPLPLWTPCTAPPVARRQLQQTLQHYDAASTALTSPLLARAGFSATAVGRFIYFIGGRTGYGGVVCENL